MKKPKKEIYPKKIQDKIYSISKKIVEKIVKQNPQIYLANAFGSVVSRKMGIYEQVYKNERHGSDVDIICIVSPNFSAPKDWEFLTKGGCFDMYHVDAVEKHIPELGEKELPIHPIKFLIYIPGIHDYEEAKEYSAIDYDVAKKKGWPVETWYINKKELERLK